MSPLFLNIFEIFFGRISTNFREFAKIPKNLLKKSQSFFRGSRTPCLFQKLFSKVLFFLHSSPTYAIKIGFGDIDILFLFPRHSFQTTKRMSQQQLSTAQLFAERLFTPSPLFCGKRDEGSTDQKPQGQDI